MTTSARIATGNQIDRLRFAFPPQSPTAATDVPLPRPPSFHHQPPTPPPASQSVAADSATTLSRQPSSRDRPQRSVHRRQPAEWVSRQRTLFPTDGVKELVMRAKSEDCTGVNSAVKSKISHSDRCNLPEPMAAEQLYPVSSLLFDPPHACGSTTACWHMRTKAY
jgi:hypothetical protein